MLHRPNSFANDVTLLLRQIEEFFPKKTIVKQNVSEEKGLQSNEMRSFSTAAFCLTVVVFGKNSC
jgi:hypothetical protein